MHGLVVILIVASAMLSVPDLGAFYRNEDFLDFDYYSRISVLECFTRPHLNAALVSFWRPVSDAATWLVVRCVGPELSQSGRAHAVLFLLHLMAVLAVIPAARVLLKQSLGAAYFAAVPAALHPASAAVIVFLDAGMAQLLFGLFAVLSLWFLGRWRGGTGRAFSLHLFTVLAMLSFDAAILWPAFLFFTSVLLPRDERRCPWTMWLWIPIVLLLRWLATGQAFAGYGLIPSQQAILEIPLSCIRGLLWLVVPRIGEVEPKAIFSVAIAVGFLAILAGSVIRGRAQPRGDFEVWWGRTLWSCVALSVLVAASFCAAVPEFVLQVGAPLEALWMKLYRLYPCVLVLSLLLSLVLGSFARRLHGIPVVGLMILLVFWNHSGQKLRQGQVNAGELCRKIREEVKSRAEQSPEKSLLLLNLPQTIGESGVPLAPVFQLGLANSLRPPAHDRTIPVYPLFSVDGPNPDMFGIAQPRTIQQLLLHPDCAAFKVDSSGELHPFELPAGASLPAPELRLLASKDSLEAVPSRVAEVEVSTEGKMEIWIEGEQPGILQLVLFNRLHPYYVEHKIAVGMNLWREPGAGGIDRLLVKSRHVLEVVRWFPGEVVFLIAQASPGQDSTGGVAVSNVLAVRLRPAAQ